MEKAIAIVAAFLVCGLVSYLFSNKRRAEHLDAKTKNPEAADGSSWRRSDWTKIVNL